MRNKKGEDWNKYLKEMNQIGPTLRENVNKGKSGLYTPGKGFEPINNKLELFDEHGARIMKSEDTVLKPQPSELEGKTRAQKRKAKRMFEKRLGKIKDAAYLEKMLKMDQSKAWLKDAQRVTAVKQEKINTWFDEEMRMLLGSKRVEKIKNCVEKKGRMPWWYFWLKTKIQHDQKPYPWGTDHLAIYVFGQLHASITYVWDNK